MKYQGPLFRAVNPIYARDPLSGRGAELYGGRFNAKGMAALYLSISIMTAIREANQAGSLQPTTLVSYDADIDHVFDCRDEAALHAEGMSPTALADTGWRDAMKAQGEAPTQSFARRLKASGWNGMMVRSFAPGTTLDDLNLVLWVWHASETARLTLIDDEKRLSRL
ncbi:RES family NAD+ phosphorylase [Elstera sp.]|uniref:RES family NAD+ phosphorylase n=1 Tax=Elstera sp. TaxID=1916664 RepID=UPI0037BF04BE